jgi:uncharacterized protein
VSEAALSRVCLACGLCCDGSLFDFVALDEGEAATLADTSATVRPDGQRLALACTGLDGKCCTLYSQRPSGCRAFVCALGKRLLTGSVTEAEAHHDVTAMQADIAALGETLERTTSVMVHARAAMADHAFPLDDEKRARVLAVNRALRQRFLGWR